MTEFTGIFLTDWYSFRFEKSNHDPTIFIAYGTLFWEREVMDCYSLVLRCKIYEERRITGQDRTGCFLVTGLKTN